MRILKKMGISLLLAVGLIIIAILVFVPFRFSGDTGDDLTTGETSIIAHRGASALAPENTMPAIEKAIALGADYVEIDVQMSKDRKLLLMHDKDVRRTSDGKGIVSELKWSYLNTLDAGCWFDPVYEGTGIPLLEEVIQQVDGQIRLLIEIKAGAGMNGIHEEVVKLIRQHEAMDWCEVQSFSDDILEGIHSLEPGIRLHKLFVMKLRFLPYIIDRKLTRFNYEKYDYIYAFNIHHCFGRTSFLKEIHAQGKKAHAWGCTRETSCGYDDMRDWDGIITDHPGKYRR